MTAEAPKVCPRCDVEGHGLWNCPWVKALEVDENDHIRRVEFLTPRDCASPAKVEQPAEENYPKLGAR